MPQRETKVKIIIALVFNSDRSCAIVTNNKKMKESPQIQSTKSYLFNRCEMAQKKEKNAI
jgi:hypothetical protein